MITVFFSNGEKAEVEDVSGYDPRTFKIPAASYDTVARTWQEQATAWFSEGGEIYLLSRL